MAKRITEEQIVQINELYAKIKVKSRVAKELGVSPATVTKYLIEGYVPLAEQKIEKFDKEPSPLNEELFLEKDKFQFINNFLKVSEQELVELETLREEILI